MPATPVQVVASSYVPSSAGVLYTSLIPTQIVNLTFCNVSGSPVSMTTYLVPLSGSPGVANQISVKTLNVGETWQASEWIGKIMIKGDMLQAVAGVASAIVASGAGVQYS